MFGISLKKISDQLGTSYALNEIRSGASRTDYVAI